MPIIYSYVVRFDSGFAPNPFYGYCTLATCKPEIRTKAEIGDWIIGTGSNRVKVRRRNHIVYAMKVTEVTNFNSYWDDERFSRKRPVSNGSRKQCSGDNIYHRNDETALWTQEESYHSHPNPDKRQTHIDRDTKVNRILISDDFYYYGGAGPLIPRRFRDQNSCNLIESGRGKKHVIKRDYILIYPKLPNERFWNITI